MVERELAVYDLDKERYFKVYKEIAVGGFYSYRFRWVHEYSNHQEYVMNLFSLNNLSYEEIFDLLERLIKLECKEGYGEIERVAFKYLHERCSND